MKTILLTTLALVAFAPLGLAQTDRAIPVGTLTVEGNGSNTIPFWSTSAVYQQVHDDSDMIALNNGAPLLISALAFRKDGTSTTSTAARTMDVQLTLGITSLNSATAVMDFATNLGANPTIVMPYTSINIPALAPVSLPNPSAYPMPFNQPFPFLTAPGNHFCWEMRHRNSTSFASMQMDVQAASSVTSALTGTGCVATGQTLPASITTRSWSLTTGTYRNVLARGPASAAAAFFLGVVPQQLTLPGLCSSLEFLPLTSISGMTTATGSMDVTISPARSFLNAPAVTLYGQFVFADAGLPLGLGLSDASMLTSPGPVNASRFYFGASGASTGNELGLTASGSSRSYGLVTILTTN